MFQQAYKMSILLAYTVMLALISAVVCPVAAQPAKKVKPIQLHPDNPHYFLWRGKPTVLITSGEHYGAVLNRAFDYNKYLKTLESLGFNLTRTFSGAYCEPVGAFKIQNNTLLIASLSGHSRFKTIHLRRRRISLYVRGPEVIHRVTLMGVISST
ncbi:MAG: hypothetical protein ACYTFW_18110 [Planctomycetota bacterium]